MDGRARLFKIKTEFVNWSTRPVSRRPAARSGGGGDKSQNKNIIAIEITCSLHTFSLSTGAQNKSREEKSPMEFKAAISIGI
jgi:hypothetical protein